MATRTESVRLELQDHYSSGMARAASQTAALNTELDRLDSHRAGTTNTSQAFVRDVDTMAASSDRGGRSIDRLSGRLALIAQSASVLGPALVPIGAVAVPAITGLANMLAAAGLAGGSLVVALNGVPDAIKAIDAYRLDPTVTNLQKARDALRDMSPHAVEFVAAFQEFQPVLSGLRDATAEGWMPGLTESLDHLERVAPRVEELLLAIGEAGGAAIADATDSLASERWTVFLEFLAEEMPSALLDLSQIVGSLTHGLGELWMAFDPLNDDFSSWLVDSARDFDTWAQGLAQTQGFADFIDYIRENGPQVEQTLAAFGRAALDIAEAAAPLGGPVLGALEVVAETFSAIADSPVGPKLLTMAAAFVVLNKALAVTGGLMARVGLAGAAGALRGTAPGALGGTTAAARMGGIVGGLTAITTAQDRARTSAGQLTQAQQQQRAAAAGLGRGLAIGAAGAVAFAVASGRLGDGLGLSNTAMLGLMGAMTGPWGAAVGAGIGLMLDFRNHTNQVQEAQQNLDAVMRNSASSYAELNAAQDKLSESRQAYLDNFDSIASATEFFASDPMEFYKLSADLLDGNIERLNKYGAASKTAGTAASELGREFLFAAKALGDTRPITAGDLVAPDVERVQGIVDQLGPAMSRLGVSVKDLYAMDPGQRSAIFDELVAITLAADKPAGRIANLTDVISNSGEVMLTAAGRADALRAALDDLLSPQMGLTAATDAWTTSLRSLNDDLAKRSRLLKGDSDGAIQNRAAIQERITALSDLLVAERRAGAGPQKLAALLRDGRAELVKFGKQADIGKDAMRNFLNGQGLTGDLIATILRKVRIEAEKTRSSVEDAYDALPKQVQTHITTKGIPSTEAEIDALVKKYELTEEERKALVTLRDLASAGLGNIQRMIAAINDKEVTITTRRVTLNEQRLVGAGVSVDGQTNSKTAPLPTPRSTAVLPSPRSAADPNSLITNELDLKRQALQAKKDELAALNAWLQELTLAAASGELVVDRRAHRRVGAILARMAS